MPDSLWVHQALQRVRFPLHHPEDLGDVDDRMLHRLPVGIL